MEGQSDIDSSDPKTGAPHRNGTLAWMIFNETRPDVTAWSKRLWDPSTNNYLVREDVWVYGNENVGTGNWTVGNGFLPKKNGPEYGFGYVIGDAAPSQVLLAKFAAGGTSLDKDWRPPSSGGGAGPLFNASLAYWRALLTPENLTATFPGYDAAAGFEVAGFLWVQGWQDGCVQAMADAYEANMANFIKDMRAAFNKPALPFAIAAFGVAGFNQGEARRREVTQAQFNVANCTLHPELGCGTVATSETRDVWRDYQETGGAFFQNYQCVCKQPRARAVPRAHGALFCAQLFTPASPFHATANTNALLQLQWERGNLLVHGRAPRRFVFSA
jgi:hypothetical protein